MIDTDNRDCTGCGACEQRCPSRCIEMKPDSEGFLAPHVWEEKCVHCDLCNKICPANKVITTNLCISAYAFHSKDTGLNAQSTSGGAFAVIARTVLKNNGIVFGATFENTQYVRHIFIQNENDLYRIQGSKYVQSEIGDSYSEAKSFLDSNRLVLFSGTACQIAGLYSYLGKEYNNLLTVDVLCHGVASPLLFRKYIDWLEHRSRKTIQSYYFREKDKGGWGHYGKAIFTDGSSIYFTSNDPYIKAFMTGASFRECCYDCKYARLERISDLTVCDFWGIQKTYPEKYEPDGVSGVIISTQKGEQWFCSSVQQNCCDASKVDVVKIAAYQSNLNHPSSRPSIRDTIYEKIMDDTYSIDRSLMPIVTKKDFLQRLIPIKMKYSIKRMLKGF